MGSNPEGSFSQSIHKTWAGFEANDHYRNCEHLHSFREGLTCNVIEHLYSIPSRYLLRGALCTGVKSLWTNMFNQLAKLNTVSWDCHQWQAHAHVWNQPTDSRRQLTWMFRDFGYVNGVERLQNQVSCYASSKAQFLYVKGVPKMYKKPYYWTSVSINRWQISVIFT